MEWEDNHNGKGKKNGGKTGEGKREIRELLVFGNCMRIFPMRSTKTADGQSGRKANEKLVGAPGEVWVKGRGKGKDPQSEKGDDNAVHSKNRASASFNSRWGKIVEGVAIAGI